MPATPFPLPVSLFSRDLVQTCSNALEEAWLLLGKDREQLILSPEVARLAMASGIVIAATIGVRDPRRLAKAALDYLDQAAARCIPTLQPIDGEDRAVLRQPESYRQRAEELRSIADTQSSSEAKRYLEAVAVDYERMATSVERIHSSRQVLNDLPPMRRP